MWELDYKQSWVPKNWSFWTVVLEKTLESPLDSKKIQSVNPKGNQTWIFIGRTDAKAEAPILWPADAKNWLIWKDPDAGKDWRWEEKGTTEDKTVGWHHRLSGHEFEQAPGVGDRQRSLACCSLWGHKELDMTEQLNWTVLALCNSPHSVECVSLWINPLLTYHFVSYWILSVMRHQEPELHYCGFWLGSSPSHVDSSPNRKKMVSLLSLSFWMVLPYRLLRSEILLLASMSTGQSLYRKGVTELEDGL